MGANSFQKKSRSPAARRVVSEYVLSASTPDQFPGEEYPEIAFLGRSNVGKSSLINALLGQKALAFTSSKPGCTQSINFYRVDGSCYFVDLPGYGYARVLKTGLLSGKSSLKVICSKEGS